MCIRDRYYRVPPPQPRTTNDASQLRTVMPKRVTSPVSYTHLRAHETRRNLVCRRPPRSTLDRSSAASDVYKRQVLQGTATAIENYQRCFAAPNRDAQACHKSCLLHTSPSPRDTQKSRMPATAEIYTRSLVGSVRCV